MKLLIMGGTEFVSAAIAKHLITKGHQVDIFTRGSKKINYAGIHKPIMGNRRNSDDLKQLKNIAYEGVIDVSAYTKQDVKTLLDHLDKKALKKYVFISSGAVYEPFIGVLKEENPRGFNLNWGPYGLNKKEAEDYLFEQHTCCNLPITIFRPSYIYGEGNNLYRQTYFMDRINNKESLLYPKGNSSVQFVHIEDVVKTIESCLDHDISNGKAYNLTHEEVITWEGLLNKTMAMMKEKVDTIGVTKEVMAECQVAHEREFFPYRDVTYLMSNVCVKKDGLHIADIQLSEGLKRTYEWYIASNITIKDVNMNKQEKILAWYDHD